jgi:hypothetical protein
LKAAFLTFAQGGARALLVSGEPLFIVRREQIFVVWEYPVPDYYGDRAKEICKENGWPFPPQDGGQQAKLRRIIDNELPPPRKVPRRPATAAERHAAAEMGRAMSAAHGGGEYPDLQPGVGFSRFDHPGRS